MGGDASERQTRMRTRSRFDDAAAQWDQNPARVELAGAAGAAILGAIRVRKSWRALDYGAGTGLLTLNLHPHVASMVALDASLGMRAELKRKLASSQIRNIDTQVWNLEARPYPAQDFDLVVSSMTLHHIKNVPLVLGRLAAVLKPGGWMAVLDLDTEDGSFHGTADDVYHHGFARRQIADWLKASGLACVSVTDAHVIKKKNALGDVRAYGVFLGVGRKESVGL